MSLEEVYQAIKYDDTATVSAYIDTLVFNSKTVDLLNTFMFQAIKYRADNTTDLLICTYHANPIVYNNWTSKYAYQLSSRKIWNLLADGCNPDECCTDNE